MLHDENSAQSAELAWQKQFSKGELPDDIPTKEIKTGEWLIQNLLIELNLVESKSEGRRMLEQGGVKINQAKIVNETVAVSSGDIVQVGKRKFVKIK
jgi:tyrosyl-tRNA synthetase